MPFHTRHSTANSGHRRAAAYLCGDHYHRVTATYDHFEIRYRRSHLHWLEDVISTTILHRFNVLFRRRHYVVVLWVNTLASALPRISAIHHWPRPTFLPWAASACMPASYSIRPIPTYSLTLLATPHSGPSTHSRNLCVCFHSYLLSHEQVAHHEPGKPTIPSPPAFPQWPTWFLPTCQPGRGPLRQLAAFSAWELSSLVWWPQPSWA